MARDRKIARANMTVLLTKEERRALKKLALDMDLTGSDLVRKWLHEHLQAIGADIPVGQAEEIRDESMDEGLDDDSYPDF